MAILRYLLLEKWEGKDRGVVVHERLQEGMSYESMMRSCPCPSGYEVASPRIVEAIYAECVPVMILDGYVPPFCDVLEGCSFFIRVRVREIPEMKKILMRVWLDQYSRLKGRMKHIQRHSEVNMPPKRYDVFHMIMHSIWLRRFNIHIHNASTQNK
ncbi:hypothetical protein Nepgr_013836 [Nepenthes gracilis]|uniref:Exostosin GT47 domain-containing protein n=1 Tax=Nepenthes gracilis TaxID=150966 RepID=A0AAD3SJJ4_NEPGR|nr:hypothetical protein Nepgr_013836 [Nepenthes gracilis]